MPSSNWPTVNSSLSENWHIVHNEDERKFFILLIERQKEQKNPQALEIIATALSFYGVYPLKSKGI